MIGIAPMKTKITNINCCRVIPKSNHFIVEFIYTIPDVIQKAYNDKAIGVDLGLNNLATNVSTTGVSFIINGRPLKSINAFYNKKKANLQSQLNSEVFTSKRIERLTLKRNNKIKDYVHKASRYIVNEASKLNVTKIVIGNNKNWKQNINLGKRNNQNFVSIPFSHLIEKIEYKAKMVGIETIVIEESYTSKCSSYDLESIQKHDNYVGKRTKRGLFRTKENKYINADANGATNILRKVVSNTVYNHIDEIRSCVVQPNKIKTFY